MKRFLTMFGLLALIFAVGCEDTQEQLPPPQEQNLSLDHSELAFTAEGGSVQVFVTATDSWKASGGAEWSTLSATNGEGDTRLTVTAAANTGDARTTSYTFVMGEKRVVLNLAQLAADQDPFDTLKSLYEVPAEGAFIQIPLPAESLEDIEWSYDYAHEWIAIRVGENEDQTFCGIEIEVYANSEPSVRECVVTITKGEDSKDVTVRQAGSEAYVEATPEVVEVDFTEQEITLSVGGNVEFETTYSDGCDWISFKNENYEGTHFIISENPTSTPREGQIIFVNTTYDVSAVVTVKQEGRPERPASPPNNQIWYSTWGYGETPYVDSESFDRAIVSNVYYWEEKLGIITFDGDVTEVKPEGWSYDDRCTKIILPESVTKIGDKGFYKCSRLETFIAPGLAQMGKQAFAETSKLVNFDFSGPMQDIPERCFSKSGLEELVIPGHIKDISGFRAFEECENLKTVVFEEGVESISGDYMFDSATSIESVKFPSTLKTVGEGAFYANYGITSIEWGGVENIGRYSFSACTSLEELEVPATIKYVGGGAFHECKGLKKVVIAAETIDSGAFSNCTSLTDIEIKPTTTNWIGQGVFADCDALEHFTFPDHFKSTGENTFKDCNNLKTIDFANVEVIQSTCFAYCTGLTEVNIPGTVKKIEYLAYQACNNITSVIFNEGTEVIYSSFNTLKIKSYTIPASVKVMGGVFVDDKNSTIYFEGDCPAMAEDIDNRWCRDSAATVYCHAAYYDNFKAKMNTHLGRYVNLCIY